MDKEDAACNKEEEKLYIYRWIEKSISSISLSTHTILLLIFILSAVMNEQSSSSEEAVVMMFGSMTLGCSALTVFISSILNLRDYYRTRFGSIQRSLYISSAIVLLMGALVNIIKHHQPSSSLWDYLSLLGFVVYMILSIIKSKICTYPQSSSSEEKTTKRKLSRKALLILLKPYVWPDATSSSSWINRLLVITFQQWL